MNDEDANAEAPAVDFPAAHAEGHRADAGAEQSADPRRVHDLLLRLHGLRHPRHGSLRRLLRSGR